MQDRKKIDLKQVGAIMDAVSIPGVSMATVSSDEKPSTMVLGKDTSSQTSVTPETVFGAASLSKPLFAYLMLKLIQTNSGVDVTDDAMAASAFGRGSDAAKNSRETNMAVFNLGQFNLPDGVTHFDLDTPLKDILPYEALNDADKDRGELLTARMVLSHQTGLHIGKTEFDFEPGTGYGYSGVPFEYLQKVIEKLTGSTLEDLAQKFVFKPLGMTHSSFESERVSAANSLHTTANDYALFCQAWMNDQSELMKAAFKPAVIMMKDNIIYDKAKEVKCENIAPQDLKKVAWGLGWGLQLDDKGEPSMAYHTGDMGEWRAGVAMDLKEKSATVYFSNSENGHILADQIISPHGELEHGLNYFQKYGFARRPEDLEPNWRDLPHLGLGLKRKIPAAELKAEITTQPHQEQAEDVSQSSVSSSRSSRSVVHSAPSTSGYPRAATSGMDSDPNQEHDDAQPKSRLPNPFATPTLKPPSHD